MRTLPSGTTLAADPPRRRKVDRSEVPVSFLPEGNPAARRAYLCALAGLLPGLGLVLGPLAVLFGVVGHRAALRDEQRRGLGHAYVSRILGMAELLCGGAGVICLARSAGWL